MRIFDAPDHWGRSAARNIQPHYPTGGRVSKHFGKDGNPSETLIRGKKERLDNWRTLQELEGVI